MSVNIELGFTVTGLADEAQAKNVARAIGVLLDAEGIEDQVRHGVRFDEGEYLVTGESGLALIISGFYNWGPAFEGAFARTVAEVAPTAKAEVEWGYPDEDH
ncbi:hypothetical protein [Kitasatospora sp. NPDC008115]|uniref:hypothetical protein n=1 Tax=Kitasatospora sp. NPDC008115 TaxID=3364022 RepID=UPI0036E83100